MPLSDIDYITSLLMKTGRMIRERIKSQGREGGLAHLQILIFIAENPNAVMKDVSDFLGITPPSVTVLINNLAKTGQIKRIADKKDRRAIRLALTPKGKESLKKKEKNIKIRIRKILAKLSSEERKNLITILKKLPEIL